MSAPLTRASMLEALEGLAQVNRVSSREIDVLESWRKTPTDIQWSLVDWEPPPGTQEVLTGALSPTFGTGKTTSAVMRAVRFLMSPNTDRTPAYGEGEHPIFLVTAPTNTLLRQNMIPAFRTYLPREWVVSRYESPPYEWRLANGCHLIFMPANGEIDSITAVGALADEVHKPVYEPDDAWAQIRDRVRDSTVPGRYREVIVSGIAEPTDKMLARFDRPDDPTCNIIFPGLKHSKLDDAAKRKITEQLPRSYTHVAEHGGWRPTLTENAFAEVLDLRLGETLIDGEIDVEAPTILTIDPGDKTAILLLQDWGGFLVAVGEYHLDHADTQQALEFIRDESPWGASITEIHVDTAANRDTRRLVRMVYPAIKPKDLPKGRASWRRKTKLERTQWAFQDITGRRRLKIHEDLLDGDPNNPKRSLVHSLKKARANRTGGDLVKDNVTDHVIEALAQLVVSRFPPPKRERSTASRTWEVEE